MIHTDVIDEIIEMKDIEDGGNHAQNGFDFQISSAIYIMFQNLKNKKKFKLIYEKIEDFIFFTDKIEMYQAKSSNKNLTASVLYSKNIKKDELSIIEKMQRNHTIIKKKVNEENIEISNTLLMCETNIFTKKLMTEEKNEDDIELNFENINDKNKKLIIEKTSNDNYEWKHLNAKRLIPKIRHEEVTRVFMEDAVNELYGENKISTNALYNTIANEIKKIRKSKKDISSEFITENIYKFTQLKDEIRYSDYVNFLKEDDKLNFNIQMSFNIMKDTIKIDGHADNSYFNIINNLLKKEKITTVYELLNIIKVNHKTKELIETLEEYEIKALILLVIGGNR